MTTIAGLGQCEPKGITISNRKTERSARRTSGVRKGRRRRFLRRWRMSRLPRARAAHSWLYQMNAHHQPPCLRLYLEAGAIMGMRVCKEGNAVCYNERRGRQTRGQIAGWIYATASIPPTRSSTTTGRWTSEMVIKTVRMGIPIHGFCSRWASPLGRRPGEQSD